VCPPVQRDRSPQTSGRIEIREFDANDKVTAVSRYDASLDGLGLRVAERVALILRNRNRQAEVVRGDLPIRATSSFRVG
jgi:hypothetical protein